VKGLDAGRVLMGVRGKRRWIAIGIIAVSAAVIWVYLTHAPGRGGNASQGHFVPLAAELEGIRGITLYYGVPGSDSLGEEHRDVVVKDRPADQVRAIYRELVAGPMESHVTLIPDGAEVVNAYLTPRGTLFLDWNRALVQGFRGGSGRERLLIESIVRTAAENLPDIETVSILVDGNPVETIGGHYDILAPLAVSEWR
jgi:hypothetical protein